MNKKSMIKMMAATMTATIPMGTNGNMAAQTFALEKTVFGGKQTSQYYPYKTSAWACTESDDVICVDYRKNIISTSTGEYLSSYDVLSGGKWAQVICAIDQQTVIVSDGERIIKKNTKGESLQTWEGPFDEVEISDDCSKVSMTYGQDLYVVDANGRKKVNGQTEPGIRYGSTVHRNEFGINGGMFWSPDSKKLCFYRKDESMVTSYPLVDVTARSGKVVNTKYPMAGETSEQVSMGVYDTETSKTTYLKTASPVDRYFTNISWSPDSKLIAVAEVNREQNHMWLKMYDAANGQEVKTLFEEEDEHWVEPTMPAVWTDDTHFVWASYRDGYRHLYLYDTKDGKSTQLTQGEWCVTNVYGYNKKKGLLVIQTNSEGYLYRDVCSLSLKGKMKRLSKPLHYSEAIYGGGTNAQINSSSVNVPACCYSVDVTTGKTSNERTTSNKYGDANMPQVKTVSLKSADGKHDLTGRMVLPLNFDETKKYPVIVYVYGGPHSQMVDGSWMYGTDLWMLHFAQEGYIIYSMDNRGTEMRSKEFEQAIHRQLGVCEMADQMEGVKYLKSLPYVDASRVGVYGWSFGGFMTISLMTTYADEFAAGVSGGPVCDWKYYEVMYGERYMDTPEENPEGYEKTSTLNKIGNLKGHLMVIHDGMDSTVVWQHSQALMNASIEANVFLDYAIYPNHPHNVRGHDRVHLTERIRRYFDLWLKPENK